jgi:hypothetical protein
MAPAALSIYEGLRAEVLNREARPVGLTAIAYHGMVRGLMLMMTEVTAEPYLPSEPVPFSEAVTLDRELLRLLANMVLQSQSQVMHVY